MQNDTTKPKPISVSNWDKWQTFRKDRGAPPWIKVHRNLFSNPEWSLLTDAEKGQLVSIWLLAADKNGTIPAENRIVQKMCQLDSPPDINKFIELGFLLSNGCQVVANVTTNSREVTHQRRVEESRVEESRVEKDIVIPSQRDTTKTINYTDEFLAFWFAYPNHRRGNKKRAFANWKKIDPNLYRLITDNVEARGAEDAKWLEADGKYIIHAEGFLSGDRWEDTWKPFSKFSAVTDENILRLQNIGDLNA